MDNYFSSPSLFVELKSNQLGACGTLRINRIGVPEQVKKTKLKKEGPAVTERDGDGLLYICWFDRKQVNLLSSIHSTLMLKKTVRTKSTQLVTRVKLTSRLRSNYTLSICKALIAQTSFYGIT
jgi:hypothetical protein